MLITDDIYGDFEIKSECITELINSKPMQRLKGIAQFGVPDIYNIRKGFSRYDHSVGVMLILNKLGASDEEQIAGLLHDVSHTAFSHVIDWVIGEGGSESYQDEQHESYISITEIPKILEKHGFSVDRITGYHHFGLLERDLPDLCADRLDYSLQEMPNEIATTCASNLVNFNNQIVFSDKKSARLFADNFLKLQTEHWGGFESTARYRIFADTLRLALKIGAIQMSDFWEDDEYILNKLIKSNNKNIESTLELLKKPELTHLKKSKIKIQKKFRFVDPLYIDERNLKRLSENDEGFAKEIEQARKDNEAGFYLPEVSSLQDVGL